MTASPSAAKALTGAFDRLDRAAIRTLGAVNGASGAEVGATMADMINAKHQLKASVAVVRIADEMLGELLRLRTTRQD